MPLAPADQKSRTKAKIQKLTGYPVTHQSPHTGVIAARAGNSMQPGLHPASGATGQTATSPFSGPGAEAVRYICVMSVTGPSVPLLTCSLRRHPARIPSSRSITSSGCKPSCATRTPQMHPGDASPLAQAIATDEDSPARHTSVVHTQPAAGSGGKRTPVRPE